MTARDAIATTLETSDFVINAYIKDLSDSDLFVRPVPGMNHIAGQLGHLIVAERSWIEAVRPGTCPPLPEGFAEAHARDRFSDENLAKTFTLAQYQDAWKAQRVATRAALQAIPESDYDRAEASFPPFAPTVGSLLNMCGVHALMHCGQFVAVRRQLGKPVAI